jgi:hypothetical protein
MEVPGGEEIQLHIFDCDIEWGEWSALCPGHTIPPWKGPSVSIRYYARWAPELVWMQRLDEKSFASVMD